MQLLLYCIIGWNACVMALYGLDKWQAARGGWRVSERALLLCAFALGGVGALLGMQVFRHKTRHARFRALLPVAALLCVAVCGFCSHYLRA